MPLNARHRRIFAGGLVAAVVLAGTVACSDDVESGGGGGDGGGEKVRISGQNFAEAALVASMYEQLLAENGYDPDVKLVTTRDAYMADFGKNVDVAPEYVGGIVDYLNSAKNGDDAKPLTTTDADESIKNAQPLLEAESIALLDPSEATDTNAYFVTQDAADENGWTKLSDLKGEQIVLAAHEDCEGRSDCEGGLSKQYGIDITELLPLGFATAETYKSVIDGEADLGQTSTTDGTLSEQGLVLLDDDKKIQPAQNLVPMVSSEFLADHEDIEGPLNDLMAALTTENLTELNGRVTNDREKAEDVAKDFLEEEGLL